MTAYVVIGLPILAPLAPIGAVRRAADVAIVATGLDRFGRTLGALATDSARDLDVATPSEALRTRIRRLFSAPPNAYVHLKDWGARARRGELAKPSELARLQLLARKMVAEDPDVESSTVVLTNRPPVPNGPAGGLRNCLLYEVTIQDRFGNLDNFTTTSGESD